MRTNVFISYQSDDQSLAFEICDYLEANGLSCWIAPRDIHAGEYAGEITRAIKGVDFLVLVCSKSTSKSAHVKNEVTLSFSNGCRIVPFFREATTLDDCLEYFLAGKQSVNMNGNKEESFANLLAVLTWKHVNAIANIPATKKVWQRFWKPTTWLTILLLVISTTIYYFSSKPTRTACEPTPQADTSAAITKVEETAIGVGAASARQDSITKHQTATSPSIVPSSNADTFSGKITEGHPDGVGTYSFGKARRIDMHDDKVREASAGDYIIGEWNNGHLIQGKWYSAEGTVKGTIILGRANDPENDHVFEKCTR